MDRPLAGRSILIVEDEPLIAFDLQSTFEQAGAQVITTMTLQEAISRVEMEGLSAAVVDHALRDGDSSQLCECLQKRGIPFVIYSGYGETEGACQRAPHVSKPASPEVLVTTVAGLMRAAPIMY